jgi:hypothetical protein
MLAETVLADLVQTGPLREHLVAMAWPSLGVPERLQVIQAIEADGASRTTPTWLLDLALADAAPLVRYWAARYGHFPTRKATGPTERHPNIQASEMALSHTERVQADPREIVRACLMDMDFGMGDEFTKAPQVARLAALRKARAGSGPWVIDWLAAAVMARVPINDLRECAEEFFGRADVAREFQQDDFEDGTDAYTAGETLRKCWALVRVVDPSFGIHLARMLPLKRGLYTMDAEELCDYPVPILMNLVHRAAREPALAPLIKLLAERRDELPEELQKALPFAHLEDEAAFDMQAWELRTSVGRQRAILEAVLALRSRIDGLEESLRQGEKANRKGKLWGLLAP